MQTTYNSATIARCNTILSKHAAELRAIKAQTANNWRDGKASDSQLRRINACERKLGYRESTRRQVRTAGAASDLYQSLKAELRNA